MHSDAVAGEPSPQPSPGVPGEGVKTKQRSRARRASIKLLRIALFVYLGLALMLAAFQTSLIFPGAASQGSADAIVRPFDGAELVELKAKSGEKIVALFGPAQLPDGTPHPDAANRPTLLDFYGNGMCMADAMHGFINFRRRGFNVMIPDYIGYGMSGGKPSEQGVYATADAAFDHLLARKDIDPRRIVPMGWSLGASAAFHLASTRPRDVKCVVTVSAFTSVKAMARRLFPYLPTGLVLRHHLDNESKIRAIKVPIFLGHGTRDSIIHFDMSNKLAAAAAGPVTKYDVIDGDHNDVYDIGGTGLLDAIRDFVNAHAASAGAAR